MLDLKKLGEVFDAALAKETSESLTDWLQKDRLKMKLTKWEEGEVDYGREKIGLILKGGGRRILSVAKTEEGVEFMEMCDHWFSEVYTKEEALQVIEELKEWINKE
jgi:hypothetical protein